MNTDQRELSVFRDPSAPSLAEAVDAFEQLPDESSSRKARVRSAVSMLSRLLNKPPAQITAQPNVLMRQFPRFKKIPTGLSDKSIANCKTEVQYLLRTLGLHSTNAKFRPLSAEWATLKEAFKEEPAIWKLSRFMAFCSATAQSPNAVNDHTVEQYRAALDESGEVEHPKIRVRETIIAWNKLSALAVDRQLQALTVPPTKVARWTIEPGKFPQQFQNDVARWLDRLARVDPDAEEGPIRALRPASLSLHRHQVYKAASALVFSGRAVESVTSLGCLIEIDAFKAILKTLRERQAGKLSTALHGLASTLVAIARHQEHRDDDHMRRMKRIRANYAPDDGPTKSHQRLKAFDDQRLEGELLHLPERLLREAARPKTSRRKAALLAQVAIALEVEIFAPFRCHNLVALNLEKNIKPVKINGDTRWLISFEPQETKNRQALTYELPAEAVKRIERAFKFYTQTGGWVFPGAKGSHKRGDGLSKHIKLVVEHRLGVPFHLHMMRGFVATVQMREHDNGLEYARAMVGDRSDRVVRKSYISTAERRLIRRAQDTIQKARVRSAPITRSAGESA